MKKKEFTPEQIITLLREAEVLISQGTTAADGRIMLVELTQVLEFATHLFVTTRF